jgi:hypothetical protein
LSPTTSFSLSILGYRPLAQKPPASHPPGQCARLNLVSFVPCFPFLPSNSGVPPASASHPPGQRARLNLVSCFPRLSPTTSFSRAMLGYRSLAQKPPASHPPGKRALLNLVKVFSPTTSFSRAILEFHPLAQATRPANALASNWWVVSLFFPNCFSRTILGRGRWERGQWRRFRSPLLKHTYVV